MVAGVLFVNSKIVSEELTKDAWNTWYEDKHIPDILATSGIEAAFRYNDILGSEFPWLALYPLKDIAFLGSDEFKAVPLSDKNLLPGSGIVYEVAGFDSRLYERVQLYEPEGVAKGRAKFVSATQITQDASIPDDEFNAWYAGEHLDDLAKIPGYTRSSRYKLVTALTPGTTPPKWLALHEFEELPSQEAVIKTATTPNATKMLKDCVAASWVGALSKSFGDEKADY